MSEAMGSAVGRPATSFMIGSKASRLAGGIRAIRHPATAKGKSARATRLQRVFHSGCCIIGRSSLDRTALAAFLIEAPNEDGTAMPIEPGLNAVAYVGRAIDSGVFVMGNAMFLSADIPNQVGAALDGLHLADD